MRAWCGTSRAGGTEHLSTAQRLAADVGATALVVCDRDEVLASAGTPSVTVHCRSILKSGARRAQLTEIVHHATEGALPLDI